MLPLVLIILSLGVIVYYIVTLPKKTPKKAETWVPPPIKPVDANFKLSEAKPIEWLPFVGKTNFKPSMGVKNISAKREELILVESTHLEGTNFRKEKIESHGKYTVFSNKNARTTAAVYEFYQTVLDFLHDRYPMLFDIDKEKNIFVNKISNEVLSYSPEGIDPEEVMRMLGGTIEEDVILMLKDNPTNKDEEYVVRASITGTPAGFDPSHNFDKPVSFIHKPVPQYKDKLRSPMERFFNKLEPKDLWVRGNWLIQTNNILFKLEDHHGREGDVLRPLRMDEIDFENSCFVRSERQVLTRLPKSRAVIMLVRTYLTPVKDVKARGLGETLAHAIESLPDDLAFYKRREVWGDAVKEYLRQP